MEFLPLLNNEAVFRFEQGIGSINDQIAAFEELDNLIPNNPKVKYNLTVLQLIVWANWTTDIGHKEIWKMINQLKSHGIDNTLVMRMKINFYIARTEHLEREKKYDEKNKFIREVYKRYNSAKLNDNDLVTLAKYLSYYSKFDWSKKVLAKRSYAKDAPYELMEYFIMLTVGTPKYYKSSRYIAMLQRLIDTGERGFCDLFLPNTQGGYSFQILKSNTLKQLYCEHCAQ